MGRLARTSPRSCRVRLPTLRRGARLPQRGQRCCGKLRLRRSCLVLGRSSTLVIPSVTSGTYSLDLAWLTS